MRSLRFVAAFALAISLSSPACASTQERARPAEGSLECEHDVHLPEAGSPRVLVFGEMHGSDEAPGYFAAAVCSAVQRQPQRAITAVLELPTSEDAALQRYLKSDGSEAERNRLLATPFWSNPDWQDGRASVAMFTLVEHLRVLASTRPDISVATLVPEDDGRGSHDARMARQLDAIVNRDSDAMVLVLVGNLHARRSPGSSFDPEFRSMAYLAEQPLRSYGFRVRGGRIWACMASGCGVHEMPENPNAGDPEFDLRQAQPSENYDGVIDLGRYTASPPAYRQFSPTSVDPAIQ